jgi:hypothetical protein
LRAFFTVWGITRESQELLGRRRTLIPVAFSPKCCTVAINLFTYNR